MESFRIQESAQGIRLSIHVQPRASKTEIAGVHGEALKIRVQAPPVEGAANAAVEAFLAKLFGVPKKAVKVVAGTTGREKVVEVKGITLATAQKALEGV